MYNSDKTNNRITKNHLHIKLVHNPFKSIVFNIAICSFHHANTSKLIPERPKFKNTKVIESQERSIVYAPSERHRQRRSLTSVQLGTSPRNDVRTAAIHANNPLAQMFQHKQKWVQTPQKPIGDRTAITSLNASANFSAPDRYGTPLFARALILIPNFSAIRKVRCVTAKVCASVADRSRRDFSLRFPPDFCVDLDEMSFALCGGRIDPSFGPVCTALPMRFYI